MNRLVLGALVTVAASAGCGNDELADSGAEGESGDFSGPTDSSGDGDTSGDGDGTTGGDGTGGDGTTGDATTGDGTTGDGDGDGDGDADVGDPCLPLPPLSNLDDVALASLQADIDAVLALSPVGSVDQSVQIYDFETGQIMYARNPDQVQKPASNTKLVATAAAMDVLGRDHRLLTRAFVDAPPDGAGRVIALDLVGDHEFTPDGEFYADISFPLDQLARRLFDAGLREVTGTVVLHGEWLIDGQSLGTYNAAAHRAAAASMFATSLAQVGIVAPAPSTLADFAPPVGASELARWESPPLEVTAVPINVRSHNEMADILSRHLGFEISGQSTYAAGETEMLDWLAGIGVDTTGVAFNDGSGLSHGNRISSSQLALMLGVMIDSSLNEAWTRTFSIAGVRGTLAGRQTGADTWGRSWGKTGTLYDTITLSGVLYHRHDARRYVYSILFNNNDVTLDSSGSRLRADQVIAALAEDRRAGTPPPTPTFEIARGDGPGIADLSWSASAGADGYIAYHSVDGWTWSRANACWVDSTSFRPGELDPSRAMYWRIAAWSDTGGASWPSDVLAVRPDTAAPRTLLVDGNDRWQADPAPENPRGFAHDFLVPTAEVLGTRAIDSAANERVADGSVLLEDYDVVIWSLGEESTTHETFDATEQSLVQDYLAGGGALLASGAEIGWDLWASGDAVDQMFFADAFGAMYVSDDSGTYVVEGAALPTASFFTPGHMDIAFPDELAPLAGSDAWLDYVGSAAAAGVSMSAPHRSVLLGFPIETVDNVADRTAIMNAALLVLEP